MAESAVETRESRDFTSCERTVLRARSVDEFVAARYPGWLSAKGICDLVDAGVSETIAYDASPSLSAAAILGFLVAGADLLDVDYDDRFIDPNFLADAGISASVANAYPRHLTEIDMVRLSAAGFGPRDCESLNPTWNISEVVKLAATGVEPDQASAFTGIAGLPPEMVGECVRARVDADQLSEWLRVVGPAIRTNPAALVQTALASKRLDDPVGFRFDLLRVAARSVLQSAGDDASHRPLVNALLDVIHRGGELSTTIPDSWTRERLLFVGAGNAEVVSITLIPDEPLQFDFGETELGTAIHRITAYADSLG